MATAVFFHARVPVHGIGAVSVVESASAVGDVHDWFSWVVIASNAVAGLWALGAHRRRSRLLDHLLWLAGPRPLGLNRWPASAQATLHRHFRSSRPGSDQWLMAPGGA